MGGKSSKSVSADPTPSDDQLYLYVNIISPIARSVLCVADELGIDYNAIILDFFKNEHKSEEYLKVNPSGTVPGLKNGETCIGQSREIARYLVENFHPGHSLYAPEKKAEIDELLKFDEEKCFAAALKIAKPLFQGKKVPKENTEFAKSVKLEAQERLGQKKFFGGESVSIADFFIFNNLMQTTVDPAIAGKKPDEDLALFNEYVARMMAIEHVAKKNKEFEEILGPLGKMSKLYPVSVALIKMIVFFKSL